MTFFGGLTMSSTAILALALGWAQTMDHRDLAVLLVAPTAVVCLLCLLSYPTKQYIASRITIPATGLHASYTPTPNNPPSDRPVLHRLVINNGARCDVDVEWEMVAEGNERSVQLAAVTDHPCSTRIRYFETFTLTDPIPFHAPATVKLRDMRIVFRVYFSGLIVDERVIREPS